jgi:hypothetical protein
MGLEGGDGGGQGCNLQWLQILAYNASQEGGIAIKCCGACSMLRPQSSAKKKNSIAIRELWRRRRRCESDALRSTSRGQNHY